MAKGENTLGRLNEVLFAELERLNAVDVSDAARRGRIAAGRPRKGDIRPDDGDVD